MEHRLLGETGFKVPVLSLGTATFGGGNDFFAAWGNTDADGARSLVDIALEAGVSMFDSADVYSDGIAEEILGKAIAGRRSSVIVSTKGTFQSGAAINSVGSTRHHLTEAINGSLKRLNTDYIDIYQLHAFDALTRVEETLRTLDDFVRDGKIRTIGCSNFSGWHLMKSLAASDREGLARHSVHQAYYSLVGRDFEHELMPLGLDQKVSTIVWSPLGWGRLTGKIRRGTTLHSNSRLHATADMGPPISDDYLFNVVDALDLVAKETGKSIPQIALNWLLQRPTVANVIIGARDEKQFRENLGCLGWSLSADQIAQLDAASKLPLPYPYWHQSGFADRNPAPV
jgi:aryl-alcohol dehydrogenase-like predicted oxidoreductase